MKFDLNKNEENIGFINNKMVKTYISNEMVKFFERLGLKIDGVNITPISNK